MASQIKAAKKFVEAKSAKIRGDNPKSVGPGVDGCVKIEN